ncbi:MAG: DUF3445 domain-containing protein [Thermoleophilia bacterium]
MGEDGPTVLPSLPLDSERFRLTVGVRALGPAPVALIDPDRHAAEVALRRRLLDEDHDYRFRGGGRTIAAQWEALALLLRDAAAHFPRLVELANDRGTWTWTDRLLGETVRLRPEVDASIDREPLDWVGRRLVEDLLILGPEDGFPLAAGQLCFPNDWSLPWAIGRRALDLHARVPGFEQELGRAFERLLAGLLPGRPVWRANWALRTTDALDLSPLTPPPPRAPSADRAGAEVFVRVERQTLARLPRSGAVLFTVHTRSRSLAEAVADAADARLLLGTLRSMPPQMRDYKGITPLGPGVEEYLARRAVDGFDTHSRHD